MAVAVRSVGTVANGTATITPGLPASMATDDICVIMAATANQAFPTTPPTSWTAAPTQPTGFGGAGVAGGVRLFVWWRRKTTGWSTMPALGDSGDMQIARAIAFSGCVLTGDPWDVSATNNQTTASATCTWPTITTTVANTMILGVVAGDSDIASTAYLGAVTNANLTSITERTDNWVIDGSGGGIGSWTGLRASAAAIGTSSATLGASQVHSRWIGALKPDTTINVSGAPPTVTLSAPTATVALVDLASAGLLLMRIG